MRIRRSTSRILGSVYFVPVAPSPEFRPPPPYLASCSTSLGSHGAGGISRSTTVSGELCELNRSPWDLLLSDPQVVDDLLDSYCVDLKYKTSWFLSTSMPAMLTTVKQKITKKIAKEVKESIEGEAKKAKLKNEEGKEGAPHDFMCKKNDGRGWYCKQQVSCPNTLYKCHFKKKRSYLNPYSKTRKKKHANNFNATEEFYYYAGFGLLRGKRHCRSTNTHGSAPLAPEQEEVELELPKDASSLQAWGLAPGTQTPIMESGDGANYGVGAHDDVPSCNDNNDIAGVDEGSSDEYYDGHEKNPCKRWGKPVNARPLKSLL
ncbi:hypothetical protein SETIT_9G237900v2 [Setaria italica]|uniref:WRC domain-containing protein n=1 Tax=Setaria italica TaxID=4555 RepID=K4AML5_SETIT|nr:hypothetical protein SETIT_9G237900v2 [Setaria italica]